MSGFKVDVKAHGVKKLSRALRYLAADIKAINKRSLQKVGLKAERIIVMHLQAQDLDWPALNTKYRARKIKQGLSEKTLIATSTFLQSITSMQTGNGVGIGVEKGAKDEKGVLVASIAQVLEFGSITRGVPARPLFGPSLRELAEWISSTKFFAAEIRKGLLKKYAGTGVEAEVEAATADIEPRTAGQATGPIHIGKRGGQYRVGSNGRRQYLKRK